MYVPSHFAETRPEVLHTLIRRHPLATLVTSGESGLMANHIPLYLDVEARVLRGHMSKANPQWRAVGDGVDALAIFHGPERYISPSWYPSKQEHGRVVPTWNFIAIHVYGRLALFEDRDKLLANVTELTDQQEQQLQKPWRVADAPPEYVDAMLNGIIGVTIAIDRMERKFKLSQNRPDADRLQVRHELAGDEMAEWMSGASGEG